MSDLAEKSVAAGVLDMLAEFTANDIALMNEAELTEYQDAYDQALAEVAIEEEADYEQWLVRLFPSYFVGALADHHRELWDWVWDIELGVRPHDAMVAVWARGGAKSTTAEGAVAALGARRRRNYVLYVCDTQSQADDHVGNIGTMLESHRFGIAYPGMSSRLVGKFGAVKGWRRNRLRTATGFTVDALGLDVAARGLKIDEERPDMIVFDDLDREDDGVSVTDRKLMDITHKLLPAGSSDLAVLAIQNLVNPDGIFARLAGVAKTSADFLINRRVSGPIPALYDPTYEPRPDGEGWVIVDGQPSWVGQDLDACQGLLDLIGLTAFKAEAQHDTESAGGMFAHLIYRHCQFEEVPWDDIHTVSVWCDPAVTDTQNSDSQAVQCDGITADGGYYRIRSWEERGSPVVAIKVAIAFAVRFGTRRVGIESDQGGDTWNSVYKEAVDEVHADLARLASGQPVDGPGIYLQTLTEIDADDLTFPLLHIPVQEKAGATQVSKAGRAQQMLAAYETRPIVHVLGTHLILERSLNRFGRRKPFDLTDAAYWTMRDLIKLGQPMRSSARTAAHRRLVAAPLQVAGGGTYAQRVGTLHR